MNEKSVASRRKFLSTSIHAVGLLSVSSVLSGNANAAFLPNPDPAAVVQTNAGKIRGGIADGVHIFRGVPYGDDTGGKNRFLPPTPPKAWSGIRDTMEFGNMAPQAGDGAERPAVSGQRVTRSLFTPLTSQPHSEDCLYLNLWSRGVGKKATRPVMIWLHGGGFTSGSGASSLYDGVNLCRRGDVVVVTLNHRLGALAHMNLSKIGGEKYARSGMAGMLDIVQALEWVRDNIAAFGGDPNNVMIFGESGGGRKVSTLLAMPGAKGLFHRAVIHSGPGIRFPATEITLKRSEDLFKELELKTTQLDELLALPFEKVIAAQTAAERNSIADLPDDALFFDRYGWAPVMGPDLPHWPFDPGAPQESFDVPVIIGTNHFEMALFLTPSKAFDVVDEKTLLSQVKPIAGEHTDELIAIYKKTYPDEKLRGILLLILSDDRYRMDSIKIAERKTAAGGAPVYIYQFDWETPVWDGLLRAPHALEIPFVFNNVQLNDDFTGGGSDAVALSAVMSETWINFARTGNPNTEYLEEWKPYGKQRNAMLFNDRSKLQADPDADVRKVWEKIKQY